MKTKKTTAIKFKTFWCAALIGSLWATAEAGENTAASDYARERLAKAGRTDVEFRVVPDLGHDEAFRVVEKGGNLVVEHQTPAGALYGVQAVLGDQHVIGKLETPDFKVRNGS